MADLTEPRPLTPEEIVRRASMMGLCSQTHHEHLMRDATTVRKAKLDAELLAAVSSRPLTPDPLATLLHETVCDSGDRYGYHPFCETLAARLRSAGVTLTQPQPDAGCERDCNSGCHSDSCEHHEYAAIRSTPAARPTGDTALREALDDLFAAIQQSDASTEHRVKMREAFTVADRLALASPAPTAAPGLREALLDAAADHEGHILRLITDADEAALICDECEVSPLLVLATSTPDEEAGDLTTEGLCVPCGNPRTVVMAPFPMCRPCAQREIARLRAAGVTLTQPDAGLREAAQTVVKAWDSGHGEPSGSTYLALPTEAEMDALRAALGTASDTIDRQGWEIDELRESAEDALHALENVLSPRQRSHVAEATKALRAALRTAPAAPKEDES